MYDPDDTWNGPRVPVFTWRSDDGETLWGPGTTVWIAAQISTILAEHLPDSARQAAARRLIREVFPRPVHRSRWKQLRGWGVRPEKAREAARQALRAETWEAIFSGAEVHHPQIPLDDLLEALRSRLGRRVPDDLAGPGWREMEEQRRAVPRDDPDADLSPLPDERTTDEVVGFLTAAEEARLIEEAGLTPAEREVWTLSREGLTPQEIAKKRGTTPETAHVQKSHARSKLQDAASA